MSIIFYEIIEVILINYIFITLRHLTVGKSIKQDQVVKPQGSVIVFMSTKNCIYCFNSIILFYIILRE